MGEIGALGAADRLERLHDVRLHWRLSFRGIPLIKVILISWLIAGAEYAIAVPANRLGATVYSAAHLKTSQECVMLVVFAASPLLYLGESLRLSTAAGFTLIFAGPALIFMGRW